MLDVSEVKVERAYSGQYCGALDYLSGLGEEGTVLWTVELSEVQNKVVISFVQGDLPNWFEETQRHASHLSDHIILTLAKHSDGSFPHRVGRGR